MNLERENKMNAAIMPASDITEAAEQITKALASANCRASEVMELAGKKADKIRGEVMKQISQKGGPLNVLRGASSIAKDELENSLMPVCFRVIVLYIALELNKHYERMLKALESNSEEPVSLMVSEPLSVPMASLEHAFLVHWAEQYVEVNLSPLNDDKLTDAIKLEFAPYIESGLLPPGTEIYARRCGSRIDVCGTLSL